MKINTPANRPFSGEPNRVSGRMASLRGIRPLTRLGSPGIPMRTFGAAFTVNRTQSIVANPTPYGVRLARSYSSISGCHLG